jgi:hypothetical protein
MLERKPRIYLPATCKGGHESGKNLTLDTRLQGRLSTLSGPSAWVEIEIPATPEFSDCP